MQHRMHRYIDALVARRGHASTWGGNTALHTGAANNKAGSNAKDTGQAAAGSGARAAHAPRHYLAQEILAVMAGKDGLAELDDGVQDSDSEADSQKDFYFSD